MKSGIEIINDERNRQIQQEGWTLAHDDTHAKREMAKAAACYAIEANNPVYKHGSPARWPWGEKWWKPSDDQVRNLAKAGALIAAEIDRLNRLKTKPPQLPRG